MGRIKRDRSKSTKHHRTSNSSRGGDVHQSGRGSIPRSWNAYKCNYGYEMYQICGTSSTGWYECPDGMDYDACAAGCDAVCNMNPGMSPGCYDTCDQPGVVCGNYNDVWQNIVGTCEMYSIERQKEIW